MKLLPICMGQYDHADATCNGESRSSYEKDKEPCIFRDRCSAFRRQLQHVGGQISDHLKLAELRVDGAVKEYQTPIGDSSEFESNLVRWTKEWNVQQGRVGNAKPVDKRPNRLGGRKKPRAIEVHPRNVNWRARQSNTARHRREARARDYRIIQWFVSSLVIELSVHLYPKEAGTPYGGLFISDTISSNGHVILYIRGRAKNAPVVKLRPNGATIDNTVILFPFAKSSIQPLLGSSKLAIHEVADNAYKSKLSNLDRGGVAWSAKVVARLVKSGIIKVFR